MESCVFSIAATDALFPSHKSSFHHLLQYLGWFLYFWKIFRDWIFLSFIKSWGTDILATCLIMWIIGQNVLEVNCVIFRLHMKSFCQSVLTGTDICVILINLSVSCGSWKPTQIKIFVTEAQTGIIRACTVCFLVSFATWSGSESMFSKCVVKSWSVYVTVSPSLKQSLTHMLCSLIKSILKISEVKKTELYKLNRKKKFR